ncbi:MAG: RES family NAD+ phosphorylase [Treponema sp.]|nr:RES family NAD+ phosphorylase [Treponema sp.]
MNKRFFINLTDFEKISKAAQIHNINNHQLPLDVLNSIKLMNSDPESRKSLEFFKFYYQLKAEKRFFCQHNFFNVLEEYYEQFTTNFNVNKPLFRARRMSEVEFQDRRLGLRNKDDENNNPFQGFDKEGSFLLPTKEIKANRANSRGIPCLYVANDKDTAIAEVRPFKNTKVSLATIEIKKPLKLFNLSFDLLDLDMPGHSFMKKYPECFRSIALMFSAPYENSENDEYLLTQCLSEYIRISDQFDGIIYGSSLNYDGQNIAIFGCEHGNYGLCEPISSEVYSVKNIEIQYEKV